MTIRPGEPWGRATPLQDGVSVVADDAGLGAHVAAALSAGRTPEPVAVRSGDLARAMGGGAAGRVRTGQMLVEAPIDVVRVDTDAGETGWFCVHLLAATVRWRGEVVVAANAGFLSGRDVAPRAHPNDGRVDVVRVDPSMRARARLMAWRRASTGSHLPHPGLMVVQAAVHELEFDVPLRLTLDGRRWTRAGAVRLEVIPGVATVLA